MAANLISKKKEDQISAKSSLGFCSTYKDKCSQAIEKRSTQPYEATKEVKWDCYCTPTRHQWLPASLTATAAHIQRSTAACNQRPTLLPQTRVVHARPEVCDPALQMIRSGTKLLPTLKRFSLSSMASKAARLRELSTREN